MHNKHNFEQWTLLPRWPSNKLRRQTLRIHSLFSLYVHLFLRYADTDYGKTCVAISLRAVCVLSCSALHRVSKKLCKIVLSELRHISTNFDNFLQKDGKEAKIMRGALIFNVT